jgi:hypothetical protein
MDGRSILRSSLPSGRFQSIEGIDCLECFLGGCSSGCSDRYYRTIEHLHTPVNYPSVDDPTEVEVTDPTHPLFGRRFALLSPRPRRHSVGYIFVAYRNTMGLRLPHTATSLVAAPPESEPMTKLTSHAVTELISFARQCEVLCPATQLNSGIDSPPRGKPVSAPTSRRSSRR